VKVWLDLANSPHPLLFSPVARALEQQGHEVLVTARDNAQTVALARERWRDLDVIGGVSPRSLLPKGVALARRTAGLRRWARLRRPDVALSHNSYAQILAARALRLPVVTAMDFEHQPANHLAFRAADRILVPDVLPRGVIRRQGATDAKVRRYAGFKEELYLGDFEPDAGVAGRLGLDREPGRPLVVLRTPPGRAIYHRFENHLFFDVLKTLGGQPRVRAVVLTRVPEQRRAIAALALPNCVMPGAALDARSLMYAADLVIGAGGTMTREAALLGVPTFSVFAGRTPAVDLALESRGALQRLCRPEQVAAVTARDREPVPLEEVRARGARIVKIFLEEVAKVELWTHSTTG
jgi:predicted glycosyltransferase